MNIPDPIYLYRITHISNIDFIITRGLITCPNHQQSDPNYQGIGDSTLIESRTIKSIAVAPNGRFPDYVSFYFGTRSPMLYNIQRGFNDVTQRSPDEIIYLITTHREVLNSGRPFVFSDGHAYHNFSQFYNTTSDLNQIDWNTVNLVRWNDTDDDPDRKRRKQAEYLVYQDLALSKIVAIATYNDNVKSIILPKLAEANYTINVVVQPQYYY